MIDLQHWKTNLLCSKVLLCGGGNGWGWVGLWLQVMITIKITMIIHGVEVLYFESLSSNGMLFSTFP